MRIRSDTAVPFHLTSIFTSRLILFFVLVFLYVSLITQNKALAALTLFALFLSSLSYVWGKKALSHLSIDFTLDRPRVFAGETVTIRVFLRNNKLLPVWIKVNPLFDNTIFSCNDPSGRTAFFLWYQKASFEWKIRTKKRGYFNLGRSGVTAADPLFFYPRKSRLDSPVDLTVFPKLFPVLPVRLKERHFFGSPGARSPVQDPVYILGIRQYQNATPAKMIHWNASARLGSLQEKVCEPSVQGKLLIMLDVNGFRDHETDGDFERMLETAASLANHFERKNHAVGFLTNAAVTGVDKGFVPLGRGRNTVSKILDMTARIQNRPVCSMHNLFEHHSSVLWGIQVILCRSCMTLVPQRTSRLLAAKHIPFFVITARDDEKGQCPQFFSGNTYPMDCICV